MKNFIIGMLLVTAIVSVTAAYRTNNELASLQRKYNDLQATAITRQVTIQYLSSKK